MLYVESTRPDRLRLYQHQPAFRFHEKSERYKQPDSWYKQNCIGINKIPQKAVNGYPGGKWIFITKDGKIMRTGESTLEKLKLTER